MLAGVNLLEPGMNLLKPGKTPQSCYNQGLKTGSGNNFCHDALGRMRNRMSKFDVLFAQARVHCGNKSRQIGLNHDYYLTFSI